jgi:beta-lactamase superfamily II metal-dependent hydrolase
LSQLIATLIDVGWGDSILLESRDSSGKSHYGLIDSNDTATLRSSYIFLKRFFERKKITIPATGRLFEWVLLTHAHADHGQGLKRILKEFGTKRFWYPEPAANPPFFADLLGYAAKAQNQRVGQCDLIHTNRILPQFGSVFLDVLWPTQGLKPANENNNSVVLTATLGNVCFVFTGDAEADGVWSNIASQIPSKTRFFKVPHHGSDNGTFDSARKTPWLKYLPKNANVAISSHISPFKHPSTTVVGALTSLGITYRTDEHYHVRVETDGKSVEVTYSHV